MSRFKSEKIEVNSESFDINELSVKDRRELFAKHKKRKDPVLLQVHLMQLGCDQFKGVKDDDVLDMPGTMFDEIAVAVSKISGVYDDEEGAKKPD